MDQVERARRYLERIRTMYAGVPFRDDAGGYYADDVHSFFVHCYHVGDWIIELHPAGVGRDEINEVIDANFELRVCADLCNGTKHCRLRRKRTSKQPFVAGHNFLGSGREIDEASGRVRPKEMQCQFEVLAEGEYYDALWLAERCMAVWDEYIEALQFAS